jgi:hypothetical protein
MNVDATAEGRDHAMTRMAITPNQSDARRMRATAALLDLAELGIASWLFGNVYEAVVKIPERLAVQRHETATPPVKTRRPSVLGSGSPVRYYLPSVPLTLGSMLAALRAGRNLRTGRRWVTVAISCWISGVAITAYMVRTINLKVFFTNEPPPFAERDAAIRHWYKLNVARAAAAAGALFAAHRARQACVTRLCGNA